MLGPLCFPGDTPVCLCGMGEGGRACSRSGKHGGEGVGKGRGEGVGEREREKTKRGRRGGGGKG